MIVENSVDKKRGGCLTAFLIVMMIANPATGLYYFVGGSSISQNLPNIPAWTIPLLGFIGFANLAFGIAIWKWKKWGVYGFIATATITFVINLIYLGLMAAASGIVGLIILVALVVPLWKQME